MGRSELPLDPETSPIARFAHDLRALRDAAGRPSYREMARRSHFSVTTLSQAAAGRQLPSLPVLKAFVGTCGGDVEDWEQRWRELAAGAAPDGVRQAVEPGVTTTGEKPGASRRAWWRPVGTVGLVIIAAAAVVVVWLTNQPHGVPSAPAAATSYVWPAGPDEPIRDGSDPTRAHCSSDASTWASAAVTEPDGRVVGSVELRYSALCRAAWSRFVPATLAADAHPLVTTVTRRPADRKETTFSVTFDQSIVVGNMLMVTNGRCVRAETYLTDAGKRSPDAVTACLPSAPASGG